MSRWRRFRRKAAAATMLTAACGVFSFDQEQVIPELVILAGTERPLTFTVATEILKQDTGPATAANLRLISFSITPRSEPGSTFDFIDSVHVFVESPGLPKREVAHLDPVPRGSVVLTLTVDPTIDVLPYIARGAKVLAVADGRYPASTIRFEGKVVLTVHL